MFENLENLIKKRIDGTSHFMRHGPHSSPLRELSLEWREQLQDLFEKYGFYPLI